MSKIDLYTIKGTKTGELSLPSEFGGEVNMNVVAQAIHVYEDGMHPGLRKAKTRSEVNRTTKKIYKQKGTGGARHGSRRANVFVGGGVALGPRPVRRVLVLSDKLKKRARQMAFALKLQEKEMIGVSGISKIGKTKEVANFLTKLGVKANRFTIVLSEKAKDSAKFVRNLTNAKSVFFKDINAHDILYGGTLVLDEDIFDNSKVKSQNSKVEKPVKKTVKKIVIKKTK